MRVGFKKATLVDLFRYEGLDSAFQNLAFVNSPTCNGDLHNLIRWISYVPSYQPPAQSDIEKLEKFLSKCGRLLVVTGAGISTESGIPDYRSEEVGLYARSNHKPIQYQEFVKHAHVRQRYWARNFIGWPRFSSIKPNSTHYALQNLEEAGKLTCIVTQNVDRLHQKAGSHITVELHGSAYDVSCLRQCDYTIPRTTLQEELIRANPDMKSQVEMVRPDGDVELSQELVNNFKPPQCPKCNGPLKPDIIFFGDNVPKDRVEFVCDKVTESEAILVLGSTLTTYSSYRIILQGKQEGKNIGIVNIGRTRADAIANFKIPTKCGEILPPLCNSILSAKIVE